MLAREEECFLDDVIVAFVDTREESLEVCGVMMMMMMITMKIIIIKQKKTTITNSICIAPKKTTEVPPVRSLRPIRH